MKKEKLKPCPFCGEILQITDESPLYGFSFLHSENDCFFSNMIFWANTWGGKDMFIEKWNRREI